MHRQGLYWKNLPESKRRKPDNLNFLKKIAAVSYITDPCFIFTGTGSIKFPELSHKDVNRLSGKIKIFLYEAQSFYVGNSMNRGYFSEFKSDIDPLTIRSLELDSIEEFSIKTGLQITVYLCEYNIDSIKKSYPTLDLKCFDLFVRFYRSNKKVKTKTITKKFWCGNWRYALHRHLIMSWLSSKSGNYSWNYQVDRKLLITENVFDFDSLKNCNFKYQKNLLEGIDNLNHNSFFIDHDFGGKVSVENPKFLYSPNVDNHVRGEKFYESLGECFCLVSSETRFFQPYANISEKTLYGFDYRMPLILVAPPYSLKYLQKLGFRTFDRWWDESYDKEEKHETRLLKIFDLIDYIDTMNIEQLNTMYTDMKEVLDHNYFVLEQLYKNTTVID